MKKEVDMLSGSLWRKIILFALPIVTTSIIQQLFNTADTAIIGKFGERGALAAVGTNGEIVAMLVSLSAGLSIGANVLISRYIGAGKKENIRTAVTSSIITAVIFGIILAIIGSIAALPILKLIHTPQDILHQAVTYLRIYCISIPFLMIYDFGSAIFRARGDSKRPLVALMISGTVNILLNLLFVVVFHMNVVGVALATVIATAFSAVIVVYWLFREKGEFKLTLHGFDKSYFIQIIRIGIPAALQGAVFCFANIFVQASVNPFGSDTVAGSAIAMTFEYFAYYAITSFGQTATTFISQNYAAGKLFRCIKTLRICLVFAFLSCALITVPLTIFRYQASGMFTSDAQEIEEACTRIMLILIFEPICSFYEIPASAMRGFGYSTIPAIETIVGTCLFRIVWIFTVFRHFETLQSLYIVFPITWVITSIIVVISYGMLKRFKDVLYCT